MRNVSNAFRRALYENKRNYICTAIITLTDNTILTVTNAEIWQNGLSTNENVSDESTFGALGSVVVNSATPIINNIDEAYSEYDFTGAMVSINVGLLIGTSVESVKMGTFTVDDAQYNGALITLNCLDNMAKFDKPYSENTLVYPATLGTIVSDACTNCGVTLATPTFPNYNFQIDTRPTDTAITYREIISYAAVIAGCFAKCNNNGALELKWFDTDALQTEESGIDGGIFDITTADIYQSGDNVNGGTFNPWDTGDVVDGGSFTDANAVHHITALSSQDFSVDPVIITGIQLTVDSTVNAELTTVDHLYGTEGYLIKVEKNPFITETNVDAIGNYLSTNLVGLTFRKANITHLNDPSIEAGDVALVIDRKEKVYPILITNTTFNVSSYQTTICAADTPVRNSATRYSAITKSQTAAQTLVKQEKTLREAMGANLTQALNAKPGMYETRIQEAGGGYTYYMHDKPNLNESTAVIKITNEGVGITPNYQATPITWYGLTVDGTFIANIMSVIGIDFDWGTGGSLILGGQNNVNGTLTIKNAQNQTIGSWNNNGITANAGTIGPWTIGSAGIYNGLQGLTDTHNGIYIGTDGIGIYDSSKENRLSINNNASIVLDGAMSSSGTITPASDLPRIIFKSAGGALGDCALVYRDFNNRSEINGLHLVATLGDATFVSDMIVSNNAYISNSVQVNGANNVRTVIRSNLISFRPDADVGIIQVFYNSDNYNIIRNHNNGDTSVSASGRTLYLGYENTASVNFLNGKSLIDTNGYGTFTGGLILRNNTLTKGTNPSAETNKIIVFTDKDSYDSVAGSVLSMWYGGGVTTSGTSYSIIRQYKYAANDSSNYASLLVGYSTAPYVETNCNIYAIHSGDAQVVAGNNKTGNRAYVFANGNTGEAGIYSFSADGTARPILIRANNSNAINAYGAWTFNTGVYSAAGTGITAGSPIITTTTNTYKVALLKSASTEFGITAQWGGSSYSEQWISVPSSDIRLKENIVDCTVTALPLINSIRMREFDWKDGRHQTIGFIADELEELDSRLSIGGGYDDGMMNVKSVDTFYLSGYLVKAVQELSAEVNRLKKKLGE